MSPVRAPILALILGLAAPAPVPAQSLTLEDLQRLPEGSQRELLDITSQTREQIDHASRAMVRALDKLTGDVRDIELVQGETVEFGHLSLALGDCRYPVDNPASDAYAYLIMQDAGAEAPDFMGWMIASSPALNALDHYRYDVWVLRCVTA